MTDNRFIRHTEFFGEEGQQKLKNSKVVVMGAGGIGSFFIAQIALLGVGKITIIDNECIELSNRNRYLGVWHDDPIPGSKKVELAKRHVKLIDSETEVIPIHRNIASKDTIETIKNHDYVIGCVDHDGVRYFLNKVCLAYSKPYIDLASQIFNDEYGGRLKIVNEKYACLLCPSRLLDRTEINNFYESDVSRTVRNDSYGIKAEELNTSGPSVVSINGVIASLGVTAFMTLIIENDINYDYLVYRGKLGVVSKKVVDRTRCDHCCRYREKGDDADFEC